MLSPRCAALLTFLTLGLWGARGAAAPFAVGDTTVAPGTGNKIVAQFYPRLQNTGQGPAIESQLNLSLGQFADQLVQNVNQILSNLQLDRFVAHNANATAAATALLSRDYATDPTFFSLTVAAGAVGNNLAQLHQNTLERFGQNLSAGSLPDVGFDAAATVGLSFNLGALPLAKIGFFDPRQLTAFVSYGTFSLRKQVAGLSAPVNLSYYNFGIHAQYRLLPRHTWARFGLARWGGLAVALGVDTSKLTVGTAGTLPQGSVEENFAYAGQTLKADLTWKGDANLSTQFGAVVVPLEVSSHLQLLYLFTVYAAAGVDFNFGSTSLEVSGDEPVRVVLRDPQDATNTLEVARPQASLALRSAQGPTSVSLHGLLGLQLNLGVLAAFAQGSADTANNLALGLGVRAFW